MTNVSGRGVAGRIAGGVGRSSARGYREHAVDLAAAGPEVFILSVSFTVTKSAITIIFTTSEAAKCSIGGAVYVPGLDVFSTWYSNAVEHGTAHGHAKTGLAADTVYAIRVGATTDEGASTSAPTGSGYYLVRTADASDSGGGLVSIHY